MQITSPNQKQILDQYVASIKEELQASLNIISTINPHTEQTLEERFQHQVLRPLLKFQHEKLVGFFLYYSNLKKWTMPARSSQELRTWIKMRLAKDIQLRYAMLGMIIGLFTNDVMVIYEEATSDLSKRIMHMLVERIYDALREKTS